MAGRGSALMCCNEDITFTIWTHVPHFCCFVCGIHWSLVDFPYKGPVMCSFHVLFIVNPNKLWTNSWLAIELRCHDTPVTLSSHDVCDVTVLLLGLRLGQIFAIDLFAGGNELIIDLDSWFLLSKIPHRNGSELCLIDLPADMNKFPT